jgi:hypothetical protein
MKDDILPRIVLFGQPSWAERKAGRRSKMNNIDRDSARQSVSSFLQQFISKKRNTEEPLQIQLNSASFPIDVAPIKTKNNGNGSSTPHQEDSLFAKFVGTTGFRINSSNQNLTM